MDVAKINPTRMYKNIIAATNINLSYGPAIDILINNPSSNSQSHTTPKLAAIIASIM